MSNFHSLFVFNGSVKILFLCLNVYSFLSFFFLNVPNNLLGLRLADALVSSAGRGPGGAKGGHSQGRHLLLDP